MNSAAPQEYFPLSLSQQNIWSLEQACPGTPINNISTTLRLRGRVDLALLQHSVQLVLDADPTLRTRIVRRERMLMQYHVPPQAEQFPVYDFSQTGPEGLHNWEETVTREVIPLLDAPLYRFCLFRTGQQEGGLLIKLHHIISDGWTQILLCNRIGQTYLDLLDGRQPHLDTQPSYRLHVEEEARYLSSPAYGRDREYWSSVLEHSGEPALLRSVKGACISPVGRRASYALPQELNNAIYAFCTRNRVAPFSAIYLALAIYFKRMGGADRFTIGVPIFNRTRFTFKQMSGMFVSTLPFLNELKGEWSLDRCCRSLNEQWYEMLRHQRMPFSHIQRLAPGDDRLFHIALSYQNGQMLSGRDATVSFSGRWHYSGYQMEQLCIHFSNLQDDRHYTLDYDYLTQLFSPRQIDDLHQCLVNILRESLSAPDRPVCSLPILSPQEREQVLYTFNQTDVPLYNEELWLRFAQAAEQHPRRAALICRGTRITYSELAAQAARVHAALNTVSAQPGLAAVLAPRTPELFAGMLGAVRAGWAFLLLPVDTPEGRLRTILEGSGAAALLTLPQTALPADLSLPVLDLSALPPEGVPSPVQAEDSAPAYVVYTSGSTGTPKGVEISRRSLLNLAMAMAPVYGTGAVLSMCSIGFDAFLLESAAAVLNGRTVVLPEEGELESPARLGGLITGYGVGFLSTTPSRLGALMKHPQFAAAMSRLESIVCGGEAFPDDLLRRLREVTAARIYNQYGPSEATVAVSMKLLNGADTITAGSPLPNCRLYVLDQWRNPLPVGTYGQLYIGGTCVGLGYRRAPELTEQSFFHSPFHLGERLYATGDTACWTQEGEIILGGRTDRQIKLRGLRIEPQEVASCLAMHPQVAQAAATVLDQEGQPVLAAYYVSAAPIPEEELLSFAASYLPRYMLPAALMRVESIPLTHNGKVDESRLPRPQQNVGSALPQTRQEEQLLSLFRSALDRPDFGPDSDYFLSGGNSLNAMELLRRVEEVFGPRLRVSDLYTHRTPRRLAALLGRQTAPAAPKLTCAPPMERYPLSPAQQGIYVQSLMDPTGLAYSMPGAFRLSVAPDLPRLQRAFQDLVQAEPLLRCAFVQEEDGIFARLSSQAELPLSPLTGDTLEEAAAPLLLPFTLDQAPLLRAGLWEKDGVWMLVLNLHHIIGDGLTTPVLLDRLDRLYRGETLPPARLSYLDYAWHLSQSQGDPTHLDYWKQHLSPLPEPLELPGDFPRSHTFDYRGATVDTALSRTVSDACGAACRRYGVSPYVFFLSAFALLLSRLSGKEALAAGVPAAGRTAPESREMCGPFINTLPLKLSPAAGCTLSHYLAAVAQEVNAMLDHQQAGLEDITAALGLPRTLSQSPLYQVMFTQRPVDAHRFTFGGAPMTYVPLHTGTAKMDLVAELYQQENCWHIQIEYASQLFLKETVEYFGRCLAALCAHMAEADGSALLSGLNALSPKDRMELLDIPQNTVSPFLNLPIPQQFARQLALDPDAPAVIFHGEAFTRRQLDRRASQIANLLVGAGAKPGVPVGIALSRTADLAAAVLGIWKMGGAYSPLLAHYPKQRLDHMIAIAGMTHVLCDRQTAQLLPQGLDCTLVGIWEEAEEHFQSVPLKETDLAEVLFTSGSTGQPKGVMLAWRSIANMAAGFRQILSRSEGPILCTTNVVFDMFNGEVVIPLSMGKTVVMADEEEMMLPWKLAQLIRRDGVKITQSTPSRVQMWLSNQAFCDAAPALDMMIYGGEVLTQALLRKAQEASQEAIQINMYGPTEGTVYNTTRPCRWQDTVNVGWPMVNNRVYLLDEHLAPVLPTAAGDLYLAGECVTMGYISREDLTSAAYLPDPFFPGEKMYRTGDIARQRLDGSYDFLGRRDAQVKLNGQRIELDEINGAFVAQDCGVQAATVPLRREDGSMELFTYYVPQGQPLSVEEIRRRLGQVLPAYMIPTHFQNVEAMPRTPTGKIDLRALKELAQSGGPACESRSASPALQAEMPTAETAARPGSRAWLLEQWCKTLGKADVADDLSFFEQGGTSLAALSVLSRYNNHGLVLSLAQFYAHPTIREQVKLLLPQQEDASAQPVPARTIVDTSSEGGEYPRLVPDLPPRSPGRKSMKTVLLTGATGFLGAHILQALIEAGAGTVLCLTRDGDPRRLEDTLTWYFGGSCAAALMEQVEVLKGDVAQNALGLSPLDYQRLSGRLNAVWHCAADVRHYAADSERLLQTNVEGTRQVIKLARAAQVPLYHMSTASVGGDRLSGTDRAAQFTERDFDLGQNWRENLYVRSKFLAEAAVLEAVKDGLTARIFRLGRLVGRSRDGAFQKNPRTNAFWLTLRGIHAVGAIPQSMAQAPMELTPIDWCAGAAVALRHAPMTVYHLQAPAPPTTAQAAAAVVPDLQILPDEVFAARLAQAPVDQQGDLLGPLLDLWHRVQTAPPTVTVTNHLTVQQLQKVGFTRDIPGPEQLLLRFRYPKNERLPQEGESL